MVGRQVAWRHSASTLLPLMFEAWRDLRRRTAHRCVHPAISNPHGIYQGRFWP